ncbi:hypothetical protein M3Y99_00892500 [Aphelenchoides fujianensis]|nr:hypothetical protein M3Y99_00892500 [Aphelenchoides fujianensis]
MKMVCDCIPPPPHFDLPPPPDPSLVWELLVDSGEPLELFHKARLQTCVHNPLLGFLDGENAVLPALLCLFFALLAIGCLVSACVYRRRRNRPKCSQSSVNTSKTNSASADTTICTGGTQGAHWSFEDCLPLGQTVPVGYGNAGTHCQLVSPSKMFPPHVAHAQSIVATANAAPGALIRTLPKRSCGAPGHPFAPPAGTSSIRLHQAHFPSQCCLSAAAMHAPHPLHYQSTNGSVGGGYCTLSGFHPPLPQQPQYEEIGTMRCAPHYAANRICCANDRRLQRADSETIFEDLSENLRLQQQRRPPPTSRPPAPPAAAAKVPRASRNSNSSSSFTDELMGSGSDVELEQLAHLGVPLPHDVLQHRQQSHGDLHGRESGYGTGSKARAAQAAAAAHAQAQANSNSNWSSPPQALRLSGTVRSPIQSSSSGHSSQHNSPPSTAAGAPAGALVTTTAPIPPTRVIHAKKSEQSGKGMTYV